ncbi:MAG: hypothetical protein Ct9H90mP23_3150 [Methanobacteriota archaeon]|nr:MAG: hypothetical protein Ct9H90mP23_3150 [Euryarchaeota archaeon]
MLYRERPMINSISVGYGSMSGAPVVAVDDEFNAEGAFGRDMFSFCWIR